MRKLLLVLAVAACGAAGGVPWAWMGGGGVDVRPPDVDVDTPALRAAKADIGMEDCAPGTGEAVDGGLPDVTLPCLGGGPDVELSSLRGPMVINLWQAGCVPCRKEMPALETFHQEHGDRVQVLGIDFNDVHPGRALDLAGETGATYPSIADPGGDLMTAAAFALARRGIPVFLFLDADGTIAGQAAGGVDSAAEVEDLVAEHLGITL